MSLEVIVLTPEKIFLTCKTDQVILPAEEGSIGILSGHAPLITMLEPGVLRYNSKGTWVPKVLHNGFAQIEDNKVTVVVNGAEEVLKSSNFAELDKIQKELKENLDKFKLTKPEKRQLELRIIEAQIAKARVDALKLQKT